MAPRVRAVEMPDKGAHIKWTIKLKFCNRLSLPQRNEGIKELYHKIRIKQKPPRIMGATMNNEPTITYYVIVGSLFIVALIMLKNGPRGHIFYIGLYRENIKLIFLSETTRHRVLIFSMEHHQLYLYQVCSNRLIAVVNYLSKYPFGGFWSPKG